MHYSISNGQSSRVLSFPDLTGASDVHTRSSTTTVCSESAMGTYTCGACTDPTIPTSISSTEGGSICNGESTTLSQVGGTLNDATAWTWYSGSCGGTLVGTGASIAVSPTTTTTYFVRGEGGCVTPGGCQSIVITVNSLPNGSASVTNATCNGGSDGAIDLTPSGTPIFTYDWDNDGTGDFDDPQDLTGLPAGNYNVTIRDGAGCEATEGPYSVTEPSAVSYTVNITNETCATNDGELDFTGTGGSGSGYNYDFDGGGYSATSTYAGLAAGSYSIQVRDGLGCESTVGNETVTDVCGLQTQLVPADCGASYGTLDEWLNWDAVTGATQYLIRLTPQGGGTALLKVRTNLKVKMLAFGSIEYNTTYDVDINAYVGGAWIGYGPVCEITTPATLPTTMLQPAYCNQTLTSMTAFIRWDAVPGANNYHIQMIESGGGPSMNKFKAGTKVRPSQFAGIQTSTTYDVKIRAYDGTTWGPWGTVCTITTPSSFTNTEIEAMMLDNDFGQPNEHRLDIVETDWSFSLYPNPNDGDLAQFSLELDESIANDITVDVMDMSGRTLYTKEYQTSEGTGYYNALINFEGTLADGLYIVNITVNGVTQSEKLVVKK